MKRWPLKETYFWEHIPFFRLLLPLVAGIILYQSYSQFSGYAVFAIFITIVLIYTTTALLHKYQSVINIVSNLFLYASLTLAAWLFSYQYDITNNKLWFGNTLGNDNGYVIRILDKPVEKNRTWKLEVSVEKRIEKEQVYRTKGKAFIYVYKHTAANYQEGDILVVPDWWQRIKNTGNPYEFDYANYCAQKNIYYQQFISGKDILQYHLAQYEDLPLIRKIHHWCIDQLEYYIHDQVTLGLLQAMLVGDRSSLSPNIKQAYASTGIVHVLAISGAHITVFFFLVAFLLSFIKHKKYSWVKYVAALPLIWLYVIVAGGPPSAVRAALMFSILGIGFAFQKKPNSINQLLATAFILLIAQPSWLFSIGFQLSFIAVLSIILFYKYIYHLYLPTNRVLRTIWATVAVSISAEILIAPIVIYYFHLFPLQFIIANILAYVFMSTILIAGMCIIVFSPIYIIANFIASIIVLLVSTFNQIVAQLETFNPASFHYLHLSFLELILVYLTITLLAIMLILKKQRLIIVSLCSLSLLLISLCYSQWRVLTQKRLVVYNINKVTHIEFINGRKHHIINTNDKLTPENKYYAITPAHIVWHCMENAAPLQARKVFVIGKSRTIVLNEPPNLQAPLKASCLIINYKLKVQDLKQLMINYNPKQLVLGSSISRSQATLFKKYSHTNNIPLHITSIDGAFILSNR